MKSESRGPSIAAQRWRKVVLAFLLLVGVILVGLGGFVGFLWLFPEQAARMALASERKKAGLIRYELVLPGGLPCAYLAGGRGEPLMLLHGFGANKDIFIGVAQFLTQHYRVIIPDLTGFGESGHPREADYSPPAQVARVRQLANALGLGRMHLGGNSMGGQIAMTFGALHPNEVSSLWLLDPAGVWSAPPSELLQILGDTGENWLLVNSTEDFKRLLAFTMVKPPPIPEPIVRLFAQDRIRNRALEERIFPQVLGYSVEPHVAGLAIPSLIVWGDRDRTLHPATPEILRKLLTRSKVIVMHNIGHLPMLESAKECAEDYLKFRKSLSLP